MSDTITVTLSSGPANENIGNRNSWVEVDVPGKQDMFAQLVYNVGADDSTSTTNRLLSSILMSLNGVLII